jgi:hypothetical protein
MVLATHTFLTPSFSMVGSIPVLPVFACLTYNRTEFAFDIIQIVHALHIEACGICNY